MGTEAVDEEGGGSKGSSKEGGARETGDEADEGVKDEKE